MSMGDGSSWSEALARLQGNGTPHVLVSLLSCAGSTPREPGSKMVVTAEDTFDTLGGGNFELKLIEKARQLIAEGVDTSCLEQMPLGARANQCCGGHIAVLLEPFISTTMRVSVFGAGHVGIALQQLLATLPWQVEWYDSRPDAVTTATRLVGARTRVHQLDGCLEDNALPAGSHCVVLTHDHSEDQRLIAYLLDQPQVASIGLIGSSTKWARFRRRLKEQGFTDSQLARVRCPIAQQAKGHKRPAEIALGIAAELLAMAPTERQAIRLRGLAQPDINTLSQLLEQMEHSS